MTRVKICGITNLADALAAANAGADLLGFVFYARSPRCVAARVARDITAQLQGSDVRFVGVFVNESVERIRQVATLAKLDLVQLHGYESPAEVRALQPLALKALRPRSREEGRELAEQFRDSVGTSAPAFLVDAYDANLYGGTGTRMDWEVASAIAGIFPILLAGGLNPENVAPAIQQVRPWGVDVSSGVERAPGIKDHALVREFVTRAKKGQ